MAHSMVIKVNYINALRRFNAPLKEDGKFDLDFDSLRAKILSLFNLPVDADISLTYFDEDGDIVSLVDDSDLSDISNQNIKFLRINVILNNKNFPKISARTSSNPTPESSPRWPRNSPNQEDWNSKFRDLSYVLKLLPDPFRASIEQVLPNVINEIATKAASPSNPVAEKIVDTISKVGLSFLNTIPTPPSNEPGEIPESSTRTQATNVANNVRSEETIADTHVMETQPNPAPSCPLPAAVSSMAVPPEIHRPYRATNQNDRTVIHRGVQCDGCGACPIVGPRYKSKVESDFDLCKLCFLGVMNEDEYEKIDGPRPFRRHFSIPNHHVRHPHHFPSPPFPNLMRKPFIKPARAQYDNCFIMDVNIMDGFLMAPSTPFTKIWRVLNTGTLSWRKGLHLQWVGGDKLRPNDIASLEVPENGVPVDYELDITVDFVSPPSPGKYISYWKLASPDGMLFGQRLWVLIQVHEPVTTSDIMDLKSSEIPDSREIKKIEPAIEPSYELVLGFPSAPPSSSYPIIDLNLEDPQETSSVSEMETNLLKELEEMGFKKMDLNKEVLRSNQYNLEQSVETLCGVSEWDPILEELEEMGFMDKETNIMLLEKNNGSIKRVVMDLLNRQ